MKAVRSLCLALVLLLSLSAFASSLLDASDDFYYNDAANVLDYNTKSEIYYNNVFLCEATGSQIVIVTVTSTGSLTTDEYANRLFNSWGVGDKEKNNGFLLLMVITPNPDDGDYWISQGSGTGDMIDPGELGDMLYTYLEPYFAVGRYSEGTQKFFIALFEVVKQYYCVDLSYLDMYKIAVIRGWNGLTTSTAGHAYEGTAEKGESADYAFVFLKIILQLLLTPIRLALGI